MIDVRSLNRDEALKRIRIEKARLRFLDFVRFTNPDYVAEPVHEYVAARLQQFVEDCEAGKSPRLMIQMAPQHGKSTLSSRHLPAYILGRNPKWKVGLMSYSADWASALSGDARDILTSEQFKELWPQIELDQGSTAKDEWRITKKSGGGGMKAVGRDGGITGRDINALVIDDFLKNRKEAESETIRNEINEGYGPNFRTRVQKGGGVLILATPWHHADLMPFLLELAKNDPDADQWEVIRLEAVGPESGDPLGRAPGEPLAPNRYDVADLRAIKASIPERDWQALYLCRPTAEGGSVFRRDWFRFEDDQNLPGFVFQTCDTAFSTKTSADYTVIATWRREQSAYRLLDLWRGRVEFPALKDRIREIYTLAAMSWGAPVAVWVEDITSGKSLIQELQAETVLPVMAWKPDRDKVSRAHAVTPLFASKRVIFPKSAPWLSTYLQELETFPMGAHDDQVDVTTMALTLHAVVHTPAEKPVTHDFTWDDRGDENEESQSLMDQLAGVPQLRAAFAEKRRREQEHATALA